MLTEFGPEIWITSGDEVSVIGFRYPTRMAVLRLADGSVFLWSPIKLSAPLKAAVDKIGPVQHIVAPNSLHHLFIQDWAAAYPKAQLHAPPGLPRKRADLTFHDTLTDEPAPEWDGQIDQMVVRGNKITAEVVFFHRASATTIFTDLLQNFPSDWFTGWRRIIARLDLMVAPEPSVPRKFRLAFSDKAAARAAIAQVQNWPTQRVLMAHGPAVAQDGRALIQRAFKWLMR